MIMIKVHIALHKSIFEVAGKKMERKIIQNLQLFAQNGLL